MLTPIVVASPHDRSFPKTGHATPQAGFLLDSGTVHTEPRLDELESTWKTGKRAASEGRLDEIGGIDRTLQCLRDKRADALRLTRVTRQVDLGMPAIGTARYSRKLDRSERLNHAGSDPPASQQNVLDTTEVDVGPAANRDTRPLDLTPWSLKAS